MNAIRKNCPADDALASSKRAIIAALETAGIARVSIYYDGEGDSGQIGLILALDAKDANISEVLMTSVKPGVTLYDELDAFAWELLNAYHCAFYNDDGGVGEITIDAAAATVKLNHSDRVIQFLNTMTEV